MRLEKARWHLKCLHNDLGKGDISWLRRFARLDVWRLFAELSRDDLEEACEPGSWALEIFHAGAGEEAAGGMTAGQGWPHCPCWLLPSSCELWLTFWLPLLDFLFELTFLFFLSFWYVTPGIAQELCWFDTWMLLWYLGFAFQSRHPISSTGTGFFPDFPCI